MSTYQDLLKVVDGLPSGTVFSITADWCAAMGLQVDAQSVRDWGRDFKKEFAQHNCILCNEGSDGHHTYKKK